LKIKNIRWIVAALVFLSTVINYIDRQTLSVLAPYLTKELKLTDIQYGYVVQAFLIAYTVVYIPAGIVIDRYGVKIVYGLATAWWSLAAMLHGFAYSAFSLGFFRSMLGLGEGFNFIAATAIAARWFPAKERALLNGLANAAAVTGAIITPPLTVWVLLRWGWRETFLITGALGFIWLIAWYFLYHAPAKHPMITREELNFIEADSTLGASRPKFSARTWLNLLGYREVWGLLVSRTVSDPVWWFYLFWLPKYLTESRGLTIAEMGMIVWIPYLASDIGSVAGGWLSGQFIRRGWEVIAARKLVMCMSVALMPLGIITVFTKSSSLAIALTCVVLFAHMSWKTNLMTLTVDIFPKPVVASIAGIVGTGSGIGAALATSIIGYLIQNHSYVPVFIVMGFLHPIAYLFVRWLVSKARQLPPSVIAVNDEVGATS
jgi:MFS transporter, ACS family, hexuronate transporter